MVGFELAVSGSSTDHLGQEDLFDRVFLFLLIIIKTRLMSESS